MTKSIHIVLTGRIGLMIFIISSCKETIKYDLLLPNAGMTRREVENIKDIGYSRVLLFRNGISYEEIVFGNTTYEVDYISTGIGTRSPADKVFSVTKQGSDIVDYGNP